MPLAWNDEGIIHFDYEDFRDIVLLYIEFDKNSITEVSLEEHSFFVAI